MLEKPSRRRWFGLVATIFLAIGAGSAPGCGSGNATHGAAAADGGGTTVAAADGGGTTVSPADDAGGIGSEDSGPSPDAAVSASPSCSVLTGTSGAIVDGSGNEWTLVTGADGTLVVDVNGAAAGDSDNVIELTYVKGVISQENASHDWWSWTNGAWSTAANPMAICSDAGADSGAPAGNLGLAPQAFVKAMAPGGISEIRSTPIRSRRAGGIPRRRRP